jgi:AcrR family transcriptional regulator
MEEARNIIIEKATSLFSQFGTQSVSMHDVAANCGISKNILYRHFKNKGQLVADVLQGILSKINGFISDEETYRKDAEEQIKGFLNLIGDAGNSITTIFIDGVRNYHPDAFRLLIGFLQDNIAQFIKKVIAKGVEEEVHNSLFDEEFVSCIYTWKLIRIFEDATVADFNKRVFVCYVCDFFLGNIINEKKQRWPQTVQFI